MYTHKDTERTLVEATFAAPSNVTASIDPSSSVARGCERLNL